MADTLNKSTPLGLITVEITLEGEAPKIPTSEVLDLIRLLRETADNLEETLGSCVRSPNLMLTPTLGVH